MPTQGTFRSSPWALTWPTKSTNTNPLVVWFHQSEKLKMNAEHQAFLLTHQTSVRSLRKRLEEITKGGMMMMMMMMTEVVKIDTFLLTHSSNWGLDRNPDWEGTSYVYMFNVTSMLLDICFIYLCVHRNVHNDNQIRIVQLLPSSTFWNYFESWWKKKERRVLPVILCNSSPLHVTRLHGWSDWLLEDEGCSDKLIISSPKD